MGGEVRVPVYCKLYPCLVPPKPTGVTSIVITRKGGRGEGRRLNTTGIGPSHGNTRNVYKVVRGFKCCCCFALSHFFIFVWNIIVVCSV